MSKSLANELRALRTRLYDRESDLLAQASSHTVNIGRKLNELRRDIATLDQAIQFVSGVTNFLNSSSREAVRKEMK